MTLEEAIKTAIAYEIKIRDLYREVADRVSDPVGRRLMQRLGDDEQYHADYLRGRLEAWQRTGQLTLERLDSAIPDRESLTRAAARVGKEMPREDLGDEKLFLSRALQVEVETSGFYRQMVREMTDTARDMFARFLAIEEGHIAAVQAELDYLSKTGYWFGIKEFDME